VRRYGILVASSRFPETGNKLGALRCPENDVDGLYEVLTRSDLGGFDAASTLVLKNVASHEAFKRINQMLKRAGKDDLVVLYYSGHGKQQDVNGHLHLAMVDTDLEALESTSLAVDRLLSLIEVSSCNTVVLMLDCCYSGAVGKSFRNSLGDQLQQASRGRGTYLLTASTGVQAAVEKEGDRYGVLTKHIIRGIETGAADRDEDGLITMDELYSYVHDKVLEESPQEPELYARARGDVVIARSSRIPRTERQKRARELLLDLARERRIPDPLFSTAFAVLWSQPGQRNPEFDALERLIDALLLKQMDVPEFVASWFEVSGGSATVMAGAAAAPPVTTEAPPTAPPSARIATSTRVAATPRYTTAYATGRHARGVLACAFSPDGVWLASGAGDGSLFLWNGAQGTEASRVLGHDGPVWSLAFAPDGDRLISAGGDGRVCSWSVPALQPVLRTQVSEDALLTVACGADVTDVFVAGHDEQVTRLQGALWTERAAIAGGHRAVHALLRAGGSLVSSGSDGRVRVWDAALANTPREFSFHTSPVLALAYSEPSGLLASGGRDARIRLWDTRSWKGVRTLRGHTNSILALAFHPGGELLASGGADDTLRMWDVRTGEVLDERKPVHDCVQCLAFSKDGMLACGGADGRLDVYADGTEQREVQEAGNGRV
jgi:hypothetical protein